jgi:hypothetical protein
MTANNTQLIVNMHVSLLLQRQQLSSLEAGLRDAKEHAKNMESGVFGGS